MEPRELRDFVSTVHMWSRLVDWWSETRRTTRRAATYDLADNAGGDYSVQREGGEFVFRDESSGDEATWDEAADEWVADGPRRPKRGR